MSVLNSAQKESANPVAEKSAIAREIEAMSAAPVEPEGLDVVNKAAQDSDIDVPLSDFWDNKPEAVKKEEPEAAPEAKGDEEVSSDIPESVDQIIKFKANGKDVEISLDEARKRLALAEGGAQAFTKLALANKKVKELESSLPSLQKKAELLDRLEEVKHDWKAVLQIATGQDPDEFLAEAMRKQRILETGSSSEKSQLEREERLAQLERQLAAQKERQDELDKREADRMYSAEKDGLKSMLEGEFFKHKFALKDEVDSNDINEMLWAQGQRRMTEYVKKYQDHPKFKDLLPKMAQKSFEDVAGKLQRLTTGSVQAKVDEAIKAKKQKAAEQAAVASTRRISESNPDDFRGLGIREIADKLAGKKLFSF